MLLEPWAIITIFAAVSQTFRNAFQKRMKPLMGDIGASYIRFAYAMPFAWLWVFSYQQYGDFTLPSTNLTFWLWLVLASFMQVLFTVFLIKLFSYRNFAASTAFSKTDVLQSAIIEIIILGVAITLITGTAVMLGTIAVVMLSLAKSGLKERGVIATLISKETAIGIACGACLGLCNVAYKAAIISLDGGDNWLLAAGYTGAIAASLQTIAMGIWMAKITPHELKASFIHWRGALGAGFFGAFATLCWFAAFTLQSVAPVRTLGQIELLITIGISILFFKEKINLLEAISILLLATSIVMVLFG